MARIMLAAMPFTGHVMPVLSVARALVDDGHDVRVYTGSAFADRVGASGAAFVPWQHAPDFDENDLAASFPRLVGKKGVRQTIINVADCMVGTAPAQVADLDEEWRRTAWDVIAGDEMSIGAALFAERRGCPWATIAVLPLHIPSSHGAPPGLGLTPGTNPLTRLRDAALRAAVPLLAAPLDRRLTRERAALGMPRSPLHFNEIVFSPQLVVASGAAVLDFGRSDRPDHVRFIGEFVPPSAPAPLPAWWDDLDGRQVVHVTQGTQNIDPNDLTRPALDALADEDVLVVATTGVRGRDAFDFAVPANVCVAGVIPYSRLMPKTDLVITNGGWGGTLAALSRGIPLVIAGGDLDKPEIAGRVAWSGAGVNLRTGTPSTSRIAAAYRRVRDEPSFRDAATRVGAHLRSLGGAPRAAELIAALAA